jgi:hypothetical protein
VTPRADLDETQQLSNPSRFGADSWNVAASIVRNVVELAIAFVAWGLRRARGPQPCGRERRRPIDHWPALRC